MPRSPKRPCRMLPQPVGRCVMRSSNRLYARESSGQRGYDARDGRERCTIF